MRRYFITFFLLILLIAFASAGLFQKQKTCGDGTVEGNCSINQPYFCSEQVLIEKASICGCPNLTDINEDFCISPYQSGAKEINLTYILKEEENKISFIVYEGMANYLSELSPFISYSNGEEALRADFKLKKINEENQKVLLMPLVIKIQNLADNKADQARIAISLVQNIPFGISDEKISVGENNISYSRYPYEVLYEQEGACASKSELLVFLLRGLGYETVFFYHKLENHDSVGIKCPERYGLLNTSYCFVETTGSSIITDEENVYLEGIKLTSYPEIILSSTGESLGYVPEYRDAKALKRIRQGIEKTGKINLIRNFKFNNLRKKYKLE